MQSLNDYAAVLDTSQNGEDGIIQEILRRLAEHVPLDGWCSEFGAWDGVYLSNTCHLIRNKNYRAVLIEGDPRRVARLRKNFPQSRVIKIQRLVSFEGADALDGIFAECEIPKNFDFLSIDVDGVDYFIFESLKIYRPKLVCVEFNFSIPNAVDWVQPRDMKVQQGASARALVRLAAEKGYSLVASTKCNLFFVDDALIRYVIDAPARLEELNPAGEDPTYLFVGYDGQLLSNQARVPLWWHGVWFRPSEIQYLPRPLRKPREAYSRIEEICFSLLMFWRQPWRLRKRVEAWLRRSD